jgi:asparagine synthase (glutamine-hydrolysing)
MHEFVNKEKLGFNVNTINLWKSYGKKLCNRFLTDGRIIQDGWIKQEWISKYLDNDNLDVKYVNKFLGLLALEVWYRIFITKEMNKQTVLS